MDFYIAMEDVDNYNFSNNGRIPWNDANSKAQQHIFCNNKKGRLPTKRELQIIYQNLDELNALLSDNIGSQLGIMSRSQYWSSTSEQTGYYYLLNIISGEFSSSVIYGVAAARPVISASQ